VVVIRHLVNFLRKSCVHYWAQCLFGVRLFCLALGADGFAFLVGARVAVTSVSLKLACGPDSAALDALYCEFLRHGSDQPAAPTRVVVGFFLEGARHAE